MAWKKHENSMVVKLKIPWRIHDCQPWITHNKPDFTIDCRVVYQSLDMYFVCLHGNPWFFPCSFQEWSSRSLPGFFMLKRWSWFKQFHVLLICHVNISKDLGARRRSGSAAIAYIVKFRRTNLPPIPFGKGQPSLTESPVIFVREWADIQRLWTYITMPAIAVPIIMQPTHAAAAAIHVFWFPAKITSAVGSKSDSFAWSHF